MGMKGVTGVMGPPGAQGDKGNPGKPGLPGKRLHCSGYYRPGGIAPLSGSPIKVTASLGVLIHCRFGWVSWSQR